MKYARCSLILFRSGGVGRLLVLFLGLQVRLDVRERCVDLGYRPSDALDVAYKNGDVGH